jgi:hypothetical protein
MPKRANQRTFLVTFLHHGSRGVRELGTTVMEGPTPQRVLHGARILSRKGKAYPKANGWAAEEIKARFNSREEVAA